MVWWTKLLHSYGLVSSVQWFCLEIHMTKMDILTTKTHMVEWGTHQGFILVSFMFYVIVGKAFAENSRSTSLQHKKVAGVQVVKDF